MDVVNACKPDLWVSLPDDVLPWVDEKRNRLSVDHTLKWLDQCLSLQNVRPRLPLQVRLVSCSTILPLVANHVHSEHGHCSFLHQSVDLKINK